MKVSYSISISITNAENKSGVKYSGMKDDTKNRQDVSDVKRLTLTYSDTVKITISCSDPNVLFGLYSGRYRHFKFSKPQRVSLPRMLVYPRVVARRVCRLHYAWI